jgi:cytochrome c
VSDRAAAALDGDSAPGLTRLQSSVVHGEAEPAAGGVLVPRTTSTETLANPFLTGGTGLYDHSERDPFPRSAGMWAGVTGLVLTVVVAVALIAVNPAFTNGKAGGTANQLGEPAGAAAGPQLEPGSPAFDGAQLIPSKQCPGCHTIPGIQGATGTVGPNLAGVASRTKIASGALDNHGPDDLKAWILDPAAKKPGTAMPKVGLSDDEASKIAAYLATLK